MTKREIDEWIECINKELLGECNQKLEILKTSSDYTYNKAITLTEKNAPNKGWYGTSYKNCYRTWAEVEAFIEGFCKCKNANFNESER